MRTREPLVPVDVPALLDRLDAVSPGPEGLGPRQGRWLVDRWWKLHVDVIRDHRYRGNDVWEPGVWIYCCDPQGRFSTDLVTFDQCRLTESQIRRMYEFIDRWEQRRREWRWRRKTRRHRRRVTGTVDVPPPN